MKFSQLIAITIFFVGGSIALSQNEKMSQIFTYDMIGVDLTYFESIVGIPKKTNGNSRVYLIDGCDVSAKIDNYDGVNSVNELSVNIKKNSCDFIYAPDEYSTPRLSSDMTFGNNNLYAIDCLDLCPSYGGFVYEYSEGAVISDYQYLEYKTSIDNVSLPSLRSILNSKAESWDRESNNNFEYQDLIKNDLKGYKIEVITIGSGYLSEELKKIVRYD